jgi:hypothetical protein
MTFFIIYLCLGLKYVTVTDILRQDQSPVGLKKLLMPDLTIDF